VIVKILKHLGPQTRAPPRAPARGQALQATWLSLKFLVPSAGALGWGVGFVWGYQDRGKRSDRQGNHVDEHTDEPVRSGSPALGGPPSTTNTAIRAST